MMESSQPRDAQDLVDELHGTVASVIWGQPKLPLREVIQI